MYSVALRKTMWMFCIEQRLHTWLFRTLCRFHVVLSCNIVKHSFTHNTHFFSVGKWNGFTETHQEKSNIPGNISSTFGFQFLVSNYDFSLRIWKWSITYMWTTKILSLRYFVTDHWNIGQSSICRSTGKAKTVWRCILIYAFVIYVHCPLQG